MDPEIIPPTDTAQVVLLDHIFAPSTRRNEAVAAGLSVREALQLIEADSPDLYGILLNGQPVVDEDLDLVVLEAGDLVTAVKRPGLQFAAAAVGNILSSIKPIEFLKLLAPPALGVGIVYGLQLAYAQLIPTPEEADSSESRKVSVQGDGNFSARYDPIPQVLGRHKLSPPYAAHVYTRVEGGKLFGFYVFTCGKGPLEFEDLKIGDTLLFKPTTKLSYTSVNTADSDAFNGKVKVELRQGTSLDSALTLVTKDVAPRQYNVRVRSNSPEIRTSPENITGFTVIVGFPQGLFFINTSGKQKQATVRMSVDYKLAGSATWTRLGFKVITRNTRDSVFVEFNANNLTEGQYEIRVTRHTADATNPAVADQSFWTASVYDQASNIIPSYNNDISLIAMKVQLTGNFPNGIDDFNLVAKSVIKDYESSSGTWVERYSSNPASIYRHVLQGDANLRPVSDSFIDLTALATWHGDNEDVIATGTAQGSSANNTITLASGDSGATDGYKGYRIILTGGTGSGQVKHIKSNNASTKVVKVSSPWSTNPDSTTTYRIIKQVYDYNNILGQKGAKTVFQALQEVAAAGRASFNMLDGKFTVVTDDDLSGSPVQMFTPKNSWGFTTVRKLPIQPDALRVGFVDETEDWIESDRIVPASGFTVSTATDVDRIDFPGVTLTDQAFRLGQYHLNVMANRVSFHTLYCDWESLNVVRGDWVKVQHDVILKGITSGRILSVTTDGGGNVTAIQVDEPCVMDGVSSYAVRIRTASNSIYRTVTVASGAVTTLTLSSSIVPALAPATGDLFAFGLAGAETGDYKVHSIRPGAEFSAELTLVDAGSGTVIDLTDSDPPSTSPPVTTNTYEPPAPPTVVRVEGSTGGDGEHAPGPGITIELGNTPQFRVRRRRRRNR